MSLPNGLYDLLVTESVAQQIDTSIADIKNIPEAANQLADAIGRQLALILDDLPEEPGGKAHQQLRLVNELLLHLRTRLAEGATPGIAKDTVDLIDPPLRILKSVHQQRTFPTPPEAGLATPWLFTASKASPSLLQEIRRELASTDQVDILVSFITVSGVRKLRDVLQQITAQAADGRTQTRIRVLTTTYMGATEARALDELARLPGCEVRVSLDGRRTRLHAKAWIFRRRTGFGAAYVGSANLSGAALTGGLEWTVKLTQHTQGSLFSTAIAHFETLWVDNEFQRYDPDDEGHRRALAQALGQESSSRDSLDYAIPSFFDLQPKTYQQDILEQLTVERAHGRNRNLVVAATGTGKTVIAAFDYSRTCRDIGGRPRLLFVAHREEILRQALRTYREVLRDPEFGELLAGGHEPSLFDHVFATIDGVTNHGLLARFGTDYWHTVVIDECHRLAADRFDTFATNVRPDVLLGLTATPERSDGQPISRYFDQRPDGSPAVELRLWQALELQLLAPFEYYACDDPTDFSEVPWERPGEREAIDRLVTGNDIRARLVINELRRLTSDPTKCRSLVFCVSVAHAEFMADRLNRAGIPAACVVGTSSAEERQRAPKQLMDGRLSALVTVDLYNEGVDLPFVDTLLLLRPTQSPVLFQQQIGRGLRLSPNKESCLILDFVGTHRADFRFDRLLSSLTGLSRRSLVEGIDCGFSSLPPGCHIHLQRQSREQVLRSLRALTESGWRRLRSELQTYATLRGKSSIRLSDFLHEQALELHDVYRASTGQTRSGWTTLKRDAGLIVSDVGPEEEYLSRRLADLLHTDDSNRLDLIRHFAAPNDAALADTRAKLGLQMITYQIDGRQSQVGSSTQLIQRIQKNPEIQQEILELSEVLQARATLPAHPLPGLEDTPLCLHATYSAREVLTAVGWLTASRRTPFRAGVLALAGQKTELLFVTLDKSEGYHDRIAYHDYAISVDRFHWQSQNSAGPDTKSGRRYLESKSNGWQFQLFVRQTKGDAYTACGPVELESADGNRPMNIVWRLVSPLPVRMFRQFSVLRGV